MTTIPTTAKLKIIKPRWWANEDAFIVYLDPRDTTPRSFDVYSADGAHRGFIEEYETRIVTPIKGTRFVKNGRRRKFWAVNGRDHWQHLPSQAEAVRRLLNNA